MKKKSLFGFSAKLALMLVAMCGMFASCYEKEEITVDGPSTEKPVYKIAGVVSNAITGEPLAGAKVNGTTTTTDGTYELTVGTGMNVVTVSMADYKTVTSSVYVETIENGKTAVYTVNAALYPGYDDPEYKTVKYSIKGSVNNTQGKSVALTSVIIAGLDNVVVSGNTFTAENVKPGTYSAVLTAEGYNKTYANIHVAPVTAQEGTGEQAAITEISVLMQKPGEQAKYIIAGTLKYTQDDAIGTRSLKETLLIGATVKVRTNNGFSASTTSDNNGYFSMEIPFEYVTPTTIAVVSISKFGYNTVDIAVPVTPKETESISYALNGDIKMTPVDKDNIPEEDPSQGGEAAIEVPVEDAQVVAKEEILKNEEVKSSVETVAKELGIDLAEVENMPVVEVKENATIELTSVEATIDEETGEIVQGETKAVVDQITIPAGTQIIYVAGVAENVSLKRDIATEKATAAVRVYEGQPSGTVFSKPLEVAFVPQTTITVEPDYVLGVLYLDEKTNTWKADANNYAEYSTSAKSFVGKINHFSKFKFGYVSDIIAKDSTNLEAIYVEKPCYSGSSSSIVTVNGSYLGGAAYKDATPAMAAAAALKGMNEETVKYVTILLTNMVKADNANIMPKNSYTKQKLSVDLTIAPYKQVKGFNITRKQVTKTYTVHVINKDKKAIDVSVAVNKIISATLEADLEIGHTHGHGNGSDLNAGGGVITFE